MAGTTRGASVCATGATRAACADARLGTTGTAVAAAGSDGVGRRTATGATRAACAGARLGTTGTAVAAVGSDDVGRRTATGATSTTSASGTACSARTTGAACASARRGPIERDVTDVTSMSDDGYLMLRDWSALVPRTIEIRSSGGVITRTFYVAGLQRPFDDDARRWLAEKLPILVRRSGIGADERVKSIFAKRGVNGVLDEILLLGGDYARRRYFVALVDTARLDSTSSLPVLRQVGQQMTSDYERGQVLQRIASRVRLEDRAARAYVQAMAGMKSDYEKRRALTALLAARPLATGVAHIALAGVEDMHSDYDRGEVLRAALAAGGIDQTDTLFAAVGRMTSSYEQRRVLNDALAKSALGPDGRRGFLMAAATILRLDDEAGM